MRDSRRFQCWPANIDVAPQGQLGQQPGVVPGRGVAGGLVKGRAREVNMSKHRVSIPILDLGCGGAGSRLLERSLSRVSGVSCAYVNPAREVVYIDFDPELVTVESLVSKIRVAGFGAGFPEFDQAGYRRDLPRTALDRSR